ncbi:MAG: cupin domain-containing protein [Verrucomicrobia bacterium]|nr:cupin domain-containing protein [Verrucomicrobiota bacterium]
MKAIQGYHVVLPSEQEWKIANPMKVPYTDLLERSQSEILGARIWRLPPRSANTYHKHVKAEEFYFVLDGVGRLRVGEDTLTVPKHGGVLVGPDMMRQIFNDTEADTLWLILGAPEREFEEGEKFDLKLFWPTDPKQLPKELAGVDWPPRGQA